MEMSIQYPNMNQSTGVHFASLQCEDPRTGNFVSLAPAPGHLETDAIASVTGGFVGAQFNANNPERDSDFIGPISSLDRWPDFVTDPRSMLQFSESFSQPSFDFTENNTSLHSSFFSNAMIDLPSTMGTSNGSNINQAMVTQYLDIGHQGISTPWDNGSSGPVNGNLWLQDQCPSNITSENGYENLTNERIEYCMPSTQQVVQQTPAYATIPMLEIPISIPRPAMHLSSNNERKSFQVEPQQDPGYVSIGINSQLPSLLDHQLTRSKPRTSDNSTTEKRSRQLSLNGVNNSQSTVAANRSPKQRRLMAKSNIVRGSTAISDEKRNGKCGPLSEDKRRRRALVRDRTACIPCFASHLQCSFVDPREPCGNCVKLALSQHLITGCHIGSMQIYHNTLSPGLLNDFLNPIVTEKVMDSMKYIKNEVEVHMSTGIHHPPITLLVCEYILPSRKPTKATENKSQILRELPSLNYGILKKNVFQIKAQMQQHINAISNCSKVMGNKKTLSWKTLSAICRYHQMDPAARQNGILSNAIAVNRLHYVFGQSIVFDTDSVAKAVEGLQNKVVVDPSMRTITAHFLAAQLKGEMVSLLDDMTKLLLDQYNKEVRRNNPETWLICLLTHLIFCMCGELVQIQVDSFIPYRIPHGDCDAELIRDAGIELCRRIDHVVLDHSWWLIRGKLKGHLKKRNPFMHGCEILMGEAGGRSLNQAEQNLINEIRQIMNDNAEEITRKSSNPLYGGSSRTLKDSENFRKDNSGRLVARYLKALLRGGKIEG